MLKRKKCSSDGSWCLFGIERCPEVEDDFIYSPKKNWGMRAIVFSFCPYCGEKLPEYNEED
jgi:hypothetical protein